MYKVEKKDAFRLCRHYSLEENVQDALNLQFAFKENLNGNQAPRYIDKTGREYIEIPAIILGEEVIQGTGGYEFGAELVSSNALYGSIREWNDKPVVIYHTDGSARDIDNLDNEKVGYLYSAKVIGEEDEKPRIRVMMRLDVALLKLHEDGEDIIARFDRGEMMELSTGYYLKDWLYQKGTFNGKDFAAIQIDIIPDHLALLPNAKGAYGIKDGGGANRSNEGDQMKDNEKQELFDHIDSTLNEKLEKFPTMEKYNEMVGNIKESLDKINEFLSELNKKKEQEEIVANEAHSELVKKVAEKTGFDKAILEKSPDELLTELLVDEETKSLGHQNQTESEIEILLPTTDHKKEAK